MTFSRLYPGGENIPCLLPFLQERYSIPGLLSEPRPPCEDLPVQNIVSEELPVVSRLVSYTLVGTVIPTTLGVIPSRGSHDRESQDLARS